MTTMLEKREFSSNKMTPSSYKWPEGETVTLGHGGHIDNIGEELK